MFDDETVHFLLVYLTDAEQCTRPSVKDRRGALDDIEFRINHHQMLASEIEVAVSLGKMIAKICDDTCALVRERRYASMQFGAFIRKLPLNTLEPLGELRCPGRRVAPVATGLVQRHLKFRDSGLALLQLLGGNAQALRAHR